MKCYKCIKHRENVYLVLEHIDGWTLDKFINERLNWDHNIDDLLSGKFVYIIKELKKFEKDPQLKKDIRYFYHYLVR